MRPFTLINFILTSATEPQRWLKRRLFVTVPLDVPFRSSFRKNESHFLGSLFTLFRMRLLPSHNSIISQKGSLVRSAHSLVPPCSLALPLPALSSPRGIRRSALETPRCSLTCSSAAGFLASCARAGPLPQGVCCIA